MDINDKTLKRLGFRPKAKNKNELEVHVEVSKHEYISISILKSGESWIFSGLEVEGQHADKVRKEELVKYDMEEIINFLTKH
ncbi:MAG: hypothetical protein ACJA0Q_001258 [Saprospiraceae bacterium]|jgi:hypothetical protein